MAFRRKYNSKNIQNCKLRKVTANDYPFIYELIKRFLKTNLSVTFLKLPSYREFIKTYFLNDYQRYIITNENDVRFGFVVITKSNEIGYFLLPEYEGRGTATKAVRLLMKLNPRERYFATINKENKKSIKLIKKLGFYPKGIVYEKVRRRVRF